MEFQKEELDKELCQTFKRFYAETSALRETDYFIKLYKMSRPNVQKM